MIFLAHIELEYVKSQITLKSVYVLLHYNRFTFHYTTLVLCFITLHSVYVSLHYNRSMFHYTTIVLCFTTLQSFYVPLHYNRSMFHYTTIGLRSITLQSLLLLTTFMSLFTCINVPTLSCLLVASPVNARTHVLAPLMVPTQWLDRQSNTVHSLHHLLTAAAIVAIQMAKTTTLSASKMTSLSTTNVKLSASKYTNTSTTSYI